MKKNMMKTAVGLLIAIPTALASVFAFQGQIPGIIPLVWFIVSGILGAVELGTKPNTTGYTLGGMVYMIIAIGVGLGLGIAHSQNYWAAWFFVGAGIVVVVARTLDKNFAKVVPSLLGFASFVVALFYGWQTVVDAQIYQTGCTHDLSHWDCVVIHSHAQYPVEVIVVEDGWTIKFKPLDDAQRRLLGIDDATKPPGCKTQFSNLWLPRNDVPCGWILWTLAPPGGINDILAQNWRVVSPEVFGRPIRITNLDPGKEYALYVFPNDSWWLDCPALASSGSHPEVCRNGSQIAYDVSRLAAKSSL